MMSAPAHEIVVVAQGSPDWKTLYEQCIQVRIDVFVHEQKFPLEAEVDEHDKTANHFLLRLVPSLLPIGTIRMHKPAGASYYKLARLVVLKEYRKFRLGAALVNKAKQWAIEDQEKSGLVGPVDVILHSQIPVKAFYARSGFLPEGEEFDEDGAPHQKMRLQLHSAQA